MESAPQLPDDAARANLLEALGVVDSDPEQAFDDLAALATQIAGTPVALISLIDRDRQWFKACVGLDVTETPRAISFCGHTIAAPHPMVVEDATADPRFADNPMVEGPPHVRFYAGFPVSVDGVLLGTLCVLDTRPRQLDAQQMDALTRLAGLASAALERQWRANLLEELEALVHRSARKDLGARADLTWIDSALALANEVLGTATAIVSHIEGETYTVVHLAAPPEGISPGDTFRLGETWCALTFAADGLVAIEAAGASETYRGHPCYQALGLETYIGVPLVVDGVRFGTLNFSHPDARGRPWSAEERNIVSSLGLRLSHVLETTTRLGTQSQLIQVVAERMPGGLAYFDASGALQFANRAFAQARGGVSLGTPVGALLDRPIPRAGFQAALRGESRQVMDVDRPAPDGGRVDIETLFAPDHDPHGAVVGVVALELDVTHHRRAREGLRNVQRMMDSLDQVGRGVCYYDAEHKLALWNRAHAEFLAEAPEAVAQGADYSVLAQAWARIHHSAHDEESVATLATQHADFHRDPTGVLKRDAPGHRAFQIRELRLPDGGTVVTTSDVTELRRKERELLRTNAELRQFAYVASHDLKEPLRMMSAYLSLLEERFRPHLDETGQRHLGYVLDGAARMQALIDSLMSFTLVDRHADNATELDLDEVLDAALANLAVRLEETGAQIERGPLPTLRGDREQLTQLFQNVLDNGMKFAREGQAPHITIKSTALGPHRWQVVVEDRGIGVTPRFAAKAFEVFARGQSRDDYAGTGIGLAIARKVVQNHGGDIAFDPDHEGGARLVMTFSQPS